MLPHTFGILRMHSPKLYVYHDACGCFLVIQFLEENMYLELKSIGNVIKRQELIICKPQSNKTPDASRCMRKKK